MSASAAMSHAARWVSDADGDAWQSGPAQRQQVSSPVSQGRDRCGDEGSFVLFFSSAFLILFWSTVGCFQKLSDKLCVQLSSVSAAWWVQPV